MLSLYEFDRLAIILEGYVIELFNGERISGMFSAFP